MPDPVLPGQAPDAPTTPGQAGYDAMVKAIGQQGADEWKLAKSAALLKSGKFTPDMIDAYWGDAKPNANSPTVQTMVRSNVQQVGNEHPDGWAGLHDIGNQVAAGLNIDFDHFQQGWAAERQRAVGETLAGLQTIGNAAAPGENDPTTGQPYAKDPAAAIADFGTGAMQLGGGLFHWALSPATALINTGPGEIAAKVPLPQVDIGFGKSDKYLSPTALGDAAMTVAGFATGAPKAVTAVVPEAARTAAIDATRAGEITQPSHIFDNIVGTDSVTPAMRNLIPKAEDFTNGAGAILGERAWEAPGKLSNSGSRVTKNLQDIYARTGLPPAVIVARAAADPAFADELVSQDVMGNTVAPRFESIKPNPPPRAVEPREGPPTPPATSRPTRRADLLGGASQAPLKAAAKPTEAPVPQPGFTFVNSVDKSMGIMEELEASPDVAGKPQVSGAGAIGRFQIMPGTARQYGFDPTRLWDPGYNMMVARTIITDLYRRFQGNMEAMAIAYNDGPGKAARWLNAGEGHRLEAVPDKAMRSGWRYEMVPATRDEMFLPTETQQYVARARYKMGGKEPELGGVEAAHEGQPLNEAQADEVAKAQAEEQAHGEAALKEAEALAEGKITSGSLSAANAYEGMTAEERIAQTLEIVGEQPKVPWWKAGWTLLTDKAARSALIDRTLYEMISNLTPARRIDDRVIADGNMDRLNELGVEDGFRQAAASEARTKHVLQIGPIVGRFAEGVVQALKGPSMARVVQAFTEDGGDLDGFKAWMLNQRTVAKGVPDPAWRDALAAIEQEKVNYTAKIKKSKQAAAALEMAQRKLQEAQEARKNVEGAQFTTVEDEALSRAEIGAKRAQTTSDKATQALQEETERRFAETNKRRPETVPTKELTPEQVQARVMGDIEARRAYAKSKATESVDTGIPLPLALAHVADKAEAAKYSRAQATWDAMNNGVLDYYEASGMISKAQKEAMQRDNAGAYVTLRRLSGDEAPFGARGATGFGLGQALKRMVGDDGKIKDPIMATVDNIGTMIAMADRNTARQATRDRMAANPKIAAEIGWRKVGPVDPNYDAISQALKQAGVPEDSIDAAAEAYGSTIMARLERNLPDNEFFIWEEGKPVRYAVNDPITATLFRNAISKPEMTGIEKIASGVANIERSGITMLPDFAARIGGLWHPWNAYIFDPLHPFPLSTLVRGIGHVIGKSDLYQEAQVNGAFGGMSERINETWVKNNVENAVDKSGFWEKARNVATHPSDFAQLVKDAVAEAWSSGHSLMHNLDEAGRVGYFDMAKERGLPPLKAGAAARKYGIDYAEHGASMIADRLSRFDAFFRPHLLGEKQAWEAFADNGKGRWATSSATLTRAFLSITAPAAAMWALCVAQDPYLPENERFSNIPRAQKDMMLITPSINGVRIKLRYPANVGLIFGGLTTRLLDGAFSGEFGTESFRNQASSMDWVQSLIHEFVPALVPSAIEPFTDIASNHVWSTNRPLVSDDVGQRLPADRYTQNTTAPARALGKVLAPLTPNWLSAYTTPIAIEHMISGYLGTGGMSVLRAVDGVYHAASGTGRPWDFHDVPGVGAFVVQNPGMSGQVLEDFYSRYHEFQAEHASYLARRKEAQALGQASIDTSGVDMERAAAAETLQRMSGALAMQRSIIYGIDHRAGMLATEKSQAEKAVYAMSVVTSTYGLTYMDVIDDKSLSPAQKQEQLQDLSARLAPRLAELQKQYTASGMGQ